MFKLIKRILNDESGQDIIEYILVATLIAVAALATLPTVGSKVSNYWVNLNTNLT